MPPMTKKSKTSDKGRREFLRDSALAGAGATIATVLPQAAIAATPADETTKADDKYRLSPHISDYYKTLA